MALQGPIPVEFGAVFPHGAYAAGGFEEVAGLRQVQQRPGGPAGRQGHRAAAVGDRGDRPAGGHPAADRQGQGGGGVPASTAVPGAWVAVYRDRVRGPDGHPVRGRRPVQGQDKGKCGARVAYSLKATGVRAPVRGCPAARCPSTRTRPEARPPRRRSWPCRSTPRPEWRSAAYRAPTADAHHRHRRPALLVTLTLPEQLEAGHVEFARQLACHAWAYAVAVERRYRGLPTLPDGRSRTCWPPEPRHLDAAPSAGGPGPVARRPGGDGMTALSSGVRAVRRGRRG